VKRWGLLLGRKRLEPWKRVILIMYHLFKAYTTTRESTRYYRLSKAAYHAKKLFFPSTRKRRRKKTST